MRIIGITGGVGSGKSRVLSYLEETYEAVICQADHVAWKLQEPGQICYEKITAHFGREILKEDQTIDRKALGQKVFGREEELHILNQIMHPEVKHFIRSRIQEELEKETPLFVIEAALLLEEHYDEICDELWYIYTSEEIRRARLKESRAYSDEKIDAIIRSQAQEEVFRAGCQVVIDNSGTFEKTCMEIKKAMNRQEITR